MPIWSRSRTVAPVAYTSSTLMRLRASTAYALSSRHATAIVPR